MNATSRDWSQSWNEFILPTYHVVRGIFPAGLYARLFIGVFVGVTALGNGMQEGGK
jgi:hypothetical protein